MPSRALADEDLEEPLALMNVQLRERGMILSLRPIRGLDRIGRNAFPLPMIPHA